MPQDAQHRPYVYVTQHPNAWYHRTNGRGYGSLTQEVLTALAAQPGFDFADYDANGDGELDELWLVIRSEAAHRARGGPVGYSGCANLYGCAAPLAGVPGAAVDSTETPPPFTVPSPSRGSIRVDWIRSGLHVFAHTAVQPVGAALLRVPARARVGAPPVCERAPPAGGRARHPGGGQPGAGGLCAHDRRARAARDGLAHAVGDGARPEGMGDRGGARRENRARSSCRISTRAGTPTRCRCPAGASTSPTGSRSAFSTGVRAHPYNHALTGLLAPGLLVTYTSGGFTESVVAPDNRAGAGGGLRRRPQRPPHRRVGRGRCHAAYPVDAPVLRRQRAAARLRAVVGGGG